jgi:hypothetical protein
MGISKFEGNYLCQIRFTSLCSLRSQKGGEVVHFSGFARKMNHIPLSRASEASTKNY